MGGIRHEPWCITYNALVRYAYEIVIEPGTPKLADQLILHALGVERAPKKCRGHAPPYQSYQFRQSIECKKIVSVQRRTCPLNLNKKKGLHA